MPTSPFRYFATSPEIIRLQKFAATHASLHNYFNLDRHCNGRQTFKNKRDAALLEWRQLLVA